MYDKVIVEHRNKQTNKIFEYTYAQVQFTGDFLVVTTYRKHHQISDFVADESIWFRLNDIKSIKYTN